MISGVVAVVALGAAKTLVLARIDEAGIRDAADGIWDAFLGDLTTHAVPVRGLRCAWSPPPRRRCCGRSTSRRRCEAGSSSSRRCQSSAAWRVLRALALIAAGVLIVVRSDAFVDLVVLLIGLYVAYAGVAELMRMILPADQAEARADRAAGGRALHRGRGRRRR